MPTTLLNLNTATVTELERLPGLTKALATSIVRRRNEAGPFRTVWELAALPGFTAKLVQALSKLLAVEPIDIPAAPVVNWTLRVRGIGRAVGHCTGHRVSVRLERRAPTDAKAGSASGWVTDQISAYFDDHNLAQLRLPDRALLRGDLQFEVFGPAGTRQALAEPSRFTTGKLQDEVQLDFEPAPVATLTRLSNPQAAERIRLKGQVIDLGGRRIVSRQVTLFAASTPTPSSADFQPLGVATTDGQGLFAMRWPEGSFTEAYGHVAVGDGMQVPIHLAPEGAFPRTVILALDLSGLPPEEEDSCCAPGGIVPHGPDADDLASSSGVYSQDLGGGRCVDFTKPERVLEEYSYQFVVRTTDPVVKPLRIADPAPLGLPSSPPASGKSPALNLGIMASLAQRYGLVYQFLDKQPDRVDVSHQTPIDWDHEPTAYQACTVAHGHILTFKQQWVADGYSMGTLLYSLPLAPGQKKQIAIVDWERRESAARSELLTEAEELQASLTRDRDINDIVKANLAERSDGSSDSFNLGFGAGHGSSAGAGGAGSYGGMGAAGGAGAVDGFAGAIGFASSNAHYDASRDLSSSALQTLRDRTMQGASSIRNRRSTVVQTVTQGERTLAQSESVANYNHCHAITIQYFEVLRHLLVRQELVQVQECLFIPLQVSAFDQRKALQWREPLLRFLRDRSLNGAFAALERVITTDDGDPEGAYADQKLVHLSGRLRLRFQFVSPAAKAATDATEAATFDAASWNWYDSEWARFWGISAQAMFDRLRNKAQPFDQEFHRVVAPRLAQLIADQLKIKAGVALTNVTIPTLGWLPGMPGMPTTTISQITGGQDLPVDLTLVSEYQHDTPLEVVVRIRGTMPAINRRAVSNIWIAPVPSSKLPADSRILVEGGYLQYRTQFSSGTLFRDDAIHDDLTSADGVFIDTSGLTADELRNPQQEDLQLARRLLDHLNDNLEYYHKAIWVSMNPDRRYMMLDGFTAPNSGGRSIASVVDNRVIGIVGNSLVMPVARGLRLDPGFDRTLDDSEQQISLLDHYKPTTPDDPLRIALPTKGIYAEAVMGQCNSCEHKEEDRFWRWEESPIPDSPAPIQPLSTESRRSAAPDLKPEGFSSPIINMQNAPAAPDPAGLAAALQLLGNPNLFRDITGLEGTQRNALEAMKSSLQAAQQFGSEAADVAKTFGQYATNMAMQQSTGENMERINRAISTARSSGLISDEQAGDLTHSALEALVGRGVGSDSASDSRTTRERLETIRGAVDEGTIDPTTGSDLGARALERMVNDGEPSSDSILTPDSASQLIQSITPGSSFEVRDGDRLVQLTETDRGSSWSSASPERLWFDAHPEPDSEVAGDTLLLWNFGIDSSVVQEAHIAAIRRFLGDRGLGWLSSSASMDLIGRASSSGAESGNQELSEARATNVRNVILQVSDEMRRNGHRIHAIGVGEHSPIVNETTPGDMARNRSVQVIWDWRTGVVRLDDEEEVFRRAQEMVEELLGATVGGGPEVLWTPTPTAIYMMIPRIPLFEDDLPSFYGSAVPPEALSSARPASQHMPGLHSSTVRILAEELRSGYRYGFPRGGARTEAQIRTVVEAMITICRQAIAAQNARIESLESRLSFGGGGSMISDELARYARAEREYLSDDPTCLWRYVQNH